MKTLFAVAAAVLLVSAGNASAGSVTRVKLHFQNFGCAPIIDVYLQGGGAQAHEEADGCGSSHHYYGIGVRARVNGTGPAVVLGIADSGTGGGLAYEMRLQYPLVTGGAVDLEGSDGQSVAVGFRGTYSVLQ
jgi:hypothetical protein